MPTFDTIQEAQTYDMDMREYRAICEKLHHKYMLEDLGLRTKVSTRPLVKDYLFVTINPPVSLDLQQFLKTIDKMCSKSWIGSYIYVIEQRNDPDLVEESAASGVHTHILIRMNKHMKPSTYTRELKNTFRTKLDVDNFHLFNIKNIDDKEQLKIQGYMLNWKDDVNKHKKQYGDDVYRNINNLKRYYSYNYPVNIELRSTFYDDN